MAVERTLSIIKPDAVAKNVIGEIYARFERAGLKIVAARMMRLSRGDAEGFWSLVEENQDDLKWCGSSPLYTFLKAMPRARGRLERYEQWNIDEQSVVRFAGMGFTRG